MNGDSPSPIPIAGGRDRVHEVIDVVAVLRPLDLAHAGQRAVEAVSHPLDHEQAARDP
jgi:hypothetical protein